MTEPPGHDPAESRRQIDEAVERFPALRRRIYQALLIELHSRGIRSVDEIHSEARALARRDTPKTEDLDENAQVSERWDDRERRIVQRLTIEHAADALSPEQVADLIILARKREEAQSLEEIAGLSPVSFRLVADRVRRFARLPRGQSRLPPRESEAVRVALIRHFISDQLEFIAVAKRFMGVRDFVDLTDRIIGDDSGMGRIGGKAAGMVLARCILERSRTADPEAPAVPVTVPESYFVRSDVIEQFLRHQGLQELQNQKYKSAEEIENDYPMILRVFKNADFPPGIVEKLRGLLEKIGEHPLIVRSSSLLEDRFGTGFPGKYRSVFVPNQGPIESRLAELLGALAEVYASTLHPDPLSYRRRHNLLDYDENMAVLIQKVVGQRHGPWFFPVWAGVAVSRNDFRRNPRVDPRDGLARIVLGLGTRAVDRVATDCPRMMALGQPTLRPEVKPEDVVRSSQHQVDVINLDENRLETLPVTGVLDDPSIPALQHVVSVFRGGMLRRPAGKIVLASPAELAVTFDGFAAASPFPALLRWLLRTLEQAYGCPVDVEFAFGGERFHLLQCRPQARRSDASRVRVPSEVPAQDRIFSAGRDVAAGSVHGVEYVVLIDPRDYDQIPDAEGRQEVARVVRRLNERLAKSRFILMGPGRWGTRDPRMGIRVGYSGISNTRALIEIARVRGGFVPEVSFGSHFFQDLVESDIHYLALFPDEPGNVFNEAFLHDTPNALPDLLPASSTLGDVVRVIDVRAASGGGLLNLDMDEEAQEALGYLSRGQGPPPVLSA